jgi:hypothetical protein
VLERLRVLVPVSGIDRAATFCAHVIARRPWGEVRFHARDPFRGPVVCVMDRRPAFTA